MTKNIDNGDKYIEKGSTIESFHCLRSQHDIKSSTIGRHELN